MTYGDKHLNASVQLGDRNLVLWRSTSPQRLHLSWPKLSGECLPTRASVCPSIYTLVPVYVNNLDIHVNIDNISE